MPWIEALLRGQKVLARTNADGGFASEGGRVEIRYKKTDAKAYRAALGNLSVVAGATPLPDDAVVAGQAVPERTTAEKAAEKTAKAVAAVPKPSARAWIAYTDGACSGNPGPAGSGFVVIAPDGKIAEGYEHLGTSTNNVAELTGILRALEAIPKGVPELVIHTDSKYAIGVLSKGWKAKVNQELIAATKRAVASRTAAGERVTVVYVPGHAGVPMNERADELAREAIRTRGSKAAVVSAAPS
jgi:ribonuclease HI